jgi:hypothetical protein
LKGGYNEPRHAPIIPQEGARLVCVLVGCRTCVYAPKIVTRLLAGGSGRGYTIIGCTRPVTPFQRRLCGRPTDDGR